jgi:putative hydrolase of the HAD superfamily
LQNIRAITLDLDDTLWPIGPVIHNAENALWQWLGVNYPRIPETFAAEDLLQLRQEVIEEFEDRAHDFSFMRRTVLQRVADAAGYGDELVEPAFDVFYDARNSVELYPDVLPHLEQFYDRYTVIAVTNGNANLETIGIRHLFHGVVTAIEAGAAKPARQIFEIAIEKAGVATDQILHVGDHPETDVHGARKAGMRTAWINRNGDEWPEDFTAPDVTISSLADLVVLLGDGD